MASTASVNAGKLKKDQNLPVCWMLLSWIIIYAFPLEENKSLQEFLHDLTVKVIPRRHHSFFLSSFQKKVKMEPWQKEFTIFSVSE